MKESQGVKKLSGRTYPDSTYGLSFNHPVYMNMRNSVSHVNFEQTDVETCEMFLAVETLIKESYGIESSPEETARPRKPGAGEGKG